MALALALLALLGAASVAQTPAPGTAPAPDPAPAEETAGPERPAMTQRPIPFGADRRRQMRRYARRHYGLETARLREPQVVVQHFTANTSFAATFNTFAANARDPELGELPGVCTHFVIDQRGRIFQLVPLGLMCRHTVGLNWTAIGIEHVGRSDAEVMGNRRQLRASLRLTAWLRCTQDVAVRDVIGHSENTRHRLHRERVAALRDQTHGDFSRATMRGYRRMIAERACAAGPSGRGSS